MPNDKLKRLHGNLTEKWEGFNVPYEQFATDMKDTNKLKRLHGNLTEKWEGFNVPYEQFATDMGVKKKTFSGLPTADSKEVVEPSQPNGERVSKSVESITSKFTEPLDTTKKFTPEEDAGDYDAYKSNAISTIKDIQKQKKEQSIYSTPQQSEVQDGINTMVSTQEPVINPVMKDLYEKGTLTLENARKAFKQNYIDENPEVLNKLNSDSDEEVEEANKEIYKAWTKEPEELSGTERTRADRSWLEETIDSFKEGMDEREFNQKMAKELAYADDDEAKQMLEYEYKRAMESSGDIQEPQADLMSASGISKMAGTQAMPIINTTLVSLIPGVGKPAAIIYSGGDAGATSYGAAFRGTYIQARAEGMDREKAYEIAKGEAKVNFATGFLEGVAGATTGKAATALGKKFTSKFASKALKPLVEKAAVGASDMGLDAAAAATGQIINNWSSKSEGLKTDLFDGVTDEMLGEVIFSAGGKGLTQAYKSSSSIGDFRKYVKSLPPQEQQEIFDNIVDNKDNIERKILNDRTNDYLNLKGQEALDNPVVSIKKDLDRLNTINESLKEGPAKEEIGKNIEALDLMLKNVEQRVTIKEGDAENIIGADELSEMIDDPEFVAKVAAGEVDVNIANNEEVANKLNDAVIKLQEEVIAEETETTIQEEAAKEVVVDTEAGKKFALDAILTGQIQPRNGFKGDTKIREDFGGMASKDINSAIQNIKDVDSGKKKKYSKPAERLLSKLEEFYVKGDIPFMEGTGGKTIRAEGVLISDYIKRIEESRKTNETKQETTDSEMSDEMKDWLDEDEDWEGMGALNHANVSQKIVEWTGNKMPEKDIKKAIKTLRENVESGVSKKESIANALDEMKSTEWYNDLDENKQKAFDQDFRQSLGDDLKASEKIKTPTADKVFVRKEERTILKDKIKNLATGAKLGAKQKEEALTAVKKDLVTYATESLKEFPISKAKQREINNMIASANNKNIDNTMAKIDKIVEVNIEADRKQTIRDIDTLLSKRKTLLKKVGTTWKAKVPTDVIDYIKNFDTSTLKDMSREQVKDVYNNINDILTKGKADIKAVEKAKRYDRLKTSAKSFLAFRKGDGTKVSGKENIIKEFEKNRFQSLVLDGHLITSENSLNNYLKDFPNTNLDNVTVYKNKSARVQADIKDYGFSDVLKSIINPFGGAKNLLNNALSLAKTGREGLRIAREIANEGIMAERALKQATSELSKGFENKVNEIFTKYLKGIKGIDNSYPARRLRRLAALDSSSQEKLINGIGENVILTNDRLVNWYNIGKTQDAKSLLDKGVDMDIVNNYIESNPDLKEFSDYLINEFYPSLKERYEEIYTKLTGLKFEEGIYYPSYKISPENDVNMFNSITDQSGNVNSFKSIAGSLKTKVDNPTAKIDLTRGAFDVAKDYINSMERSKQFLPYAEKIDAIFNKQAVPEMIDQIGNDDYKDLVDHISTVIKGVSPRAGAKMDNKFVNTLMNLKIYASLAGKIGSIPKQLTSAFRFAENGDISLSEWIKGAPMSAKEMEVVSKILTSNYVKDRFKGMGYDLEAQRLASPGVYSSYNQIVKAISKVGMSAVSVGDIGGVLMGGIPYSVAAYRQEIKSGKSHKQAMDNAISRFIATSENTQQSSDKSQLSHMQMSNLGRLFSTYTTSQKQGMNQILTAVKELRYDKGLTKTEKVKRARKILFYATENMIFASVANGFIQNLYEYAKGFSGFDDEEEKNDFLKGLYDTMADNTQSLLSGTGYFGYLMNMVINQQRDAEWKNEFPVYTQFENIGRGSMELLNYLQPGKDWDDLSDAERKSIIKAFPIDGFVRQIKDFDKAAKGEKTYLDAIMGWKSKQEKAGFKPTNDKIYESIFGKPYYYDNLNPRGKQKYQKSQDPAYLEKQKIEKEIQEKKDKQNKQKERN